MSCYDTKKICNCNSNIKTYGVADTSRILINGNDRTALNWSEISVPEILPVPPQKPDIETINQVYVTTNLSSVRLIETPIAYDEYLILATNNEISDTIAALVSARSGIVDLVNSNILPGITEILNTEGVPNTDPKIITLNNYFNIITSLNSVLLDAIQNQITSLLAADNPNVTITREQICTCIRAIVSAINTLQVSLVNLNNLLADIVADPNLAIVATNATNLISEVNTVLANILTSKNDLAVIEDICSYTTVLVLKSNEEGTCLSGRKLVIEGSLTEKVVYTANVQDQSVHSAHFTVPFSAFVIPYANFENSMYSLNVNALVNGVAQQVNGFILGIDGELMPNLCEEFCVEAYIEDIFTDALDERTIFINITLFLLGKVSKQC